MTKKIKTYFKGKIIGYFQGKSEYGPRALGNRSILADAGIQGCEIISIKK